MNPLDTLLTEAARAARTPALRKWALRLLADPPPMATPRKRPSPPDIHGREKATCTVSKRLVDLS
jgi:hypothetical protein